MIAIDGEDVTRTPFDDFCTRLLSGPASYEMTVAGDEPMTIEVGPADDFIAALVR